MIYFVTGGTGPIGRLLVPRLLERGGTVYVLVSAGERETFAQLRSRWRAPDGQLVPVLGDLSNKRLGVSQQIQGKLKHKLGHFFHLATDYRFGVDGQAQVRYNRGVVRRALALAESLHAECFHLLSSAAVAGRYPGAFSGAMAAEAVKLDHPYYVYYQQAEAQVRGAARVRWRIYRPGVVVGDSRDGETVGVGGPYLFFEAVRSMGAALPPWGRGVLLEGGRLNLVPADFVAQALDHLAHTKKGDGECFMLTHPRGTSAGVVLEQLLALAGGPQLAVVRRRLPLAPFGAPRPGRPGHALAERFLAPFGIPVDALELATLPTRYDADAAQALLDEEGIQCPDFEDYAALVWRYWLAHPSAPDQRGSLLVRLADGLKGRRNAAALARAVQGKVVLLAGAPAELGRACAAKLARAGATVILTASDRRQLSALMDRGAGDGGAGFGQRVEGAVADLADPADVERLSGELIGDHGPVDVLINYQPSVPVAVSLVSGFSPAMIEREQGHIVQLIAGLTAPTSGWRSEFSARALLAAFNRLAAWELASRRVRFSTVALPPIQGAAANGGRWYTRLLTATVDEAAERVLQPLIERPTRLSGAVGAAGSVVQGWVPELGSYWLRQARRLGLPGDEAAAALPASAVAGQDGAPVAAQLLLQQQPSQRENKLER